ncbi:MAG: 30S ribosomal protein S27ae [Candidatus Diapherotrites archaeon]|uniref:Small ribosomal subunit protein eS31 n=1 Tax=Candidatus Iainarchaeum sp. TaxID=3101447 RepID=A0A8T3YJM6_9ARCH|nr:30S ribosomal protein S27ae [Candidatus Diapherotrites archaeon]
MAEKTGAKPGAAKKEKALKSRKGTYYKAEGQKIIRKKSCPKCGPGVFMAQHEKRTHCGRCGYTEFK